jgi:hypothetical protein
MAELDANDSTADPLIAGLKRLLQRGAAGIDLLQHRGNLGAQFRRVRFPGREHLLDLPGDLRFQILT